MHFADSHFMLGVLHLFEIALAGLAREGVKDFNIQQWRYSSQSQYGHGKLNDNCLVDLFQGRVPPSFHFSAIVSSVSERPWTPQGDLGKFWGPKVQGYAKFKFLDIERLHWLDASTRRLQTLQNTISAFSSYVRLDVEPVYGSTPYMYNYCVYIISITYTTYLYNYSYIYILYIPIYSIHICLASGVGAYDPPCGQSIVFGCFPLPPQARRRRVPLPCWRSREPEHHRRWTNWGRFEQMGEFWCISYDGLRVVLFGLRKLIKGTFFFGPTSVEPWALYIHALHVWKPSAHWITDQWGSQINPGNCRARPKFRLRLANLVS